MYVSTQLINFCFYFSIVGNILKLQKERLEKRIRDEEAKRNKLAGISLDDNSNDNKDDSADGNEKVRFSALLIPTVEIILFFDYSFYSCLSSLFRVKWIEMTIR